MLAVKKGKKNAQAPEKTLNRRFHWEEHKSGAKKKRL